METWEEIARAHLWRTSARRELPFYVEEIGSWFSAQAQLDIVGVNRRERRVLFGEVKWQRSPATIQTLDRLIEQSGKWLGRDPDWQVYYALFARSFGQELQELAETEGDIFLFTPEDVLDPYIDNEGT